MNIIFHTFSSHTAQGPHHPCFSISCSKSVILAAGLTILLLKLAHFLQHVTLDLNFPVSGVISNVLDDIFDWSPLVLVGSSSTSISLNLSPHRIPEQSASGISSLACCVPVMQCVTYHS